MSRIETLTPVQKKDFQDRIKEWRAIGLSTDPLDFEKAIPFARKLYTDFGYKEPLFLRAKSPFGAALLAGTLSNLANLSDNLWTNSGANLRVNIANNLEDNIRVYLWNNLRANLRANLGDNLGDNLGTNLRDNLGGNLGTNLGTNLGDNLWDNLGGNLGTNLGTNLGDNLWGNLEDDFKANLGNNLESDLRANLGVDLGANFIDNLWGNLGDNLWGNLEGALRNNQENLKVYQFQLWGNISYWFMLGEFCTGTLGCGGFDKCNNYAQLIRCTGWILPLDGLCILQDRPMEMHWDNGRLHNPRGPAVLYRDGWSMYVWRGRLVERSVIMDPVTIGRIEAEQNVETRRILIERYGTKQYVRDSGATKIHSDDFGTLYRKDQPNDEPIYCVNVICPSTGREYYLGIDPSAYGGKAGQNARAAVASTWRKDNGELMFTNPEQYAPLVET